MSETQNAPVRYAHYVCPRPNVEHGTRHEWARYHLARAVGWDKALWRAHKILDESERKERSDYAASRLIEDARTGLMLFHAHEDDGWRRALQSVEAWDDIAEWVYHRLRELGVDPNVIHPYEPFRVVTTPSPREVSKGQIEPQPQPTPGDRVLVPIALND